VAPRSDAWLAAVLALGAAAIGCAEEGRPYDCACSYLTDWDDPANHHVRICAPTPERAAAIGRGCAQMGAQAPVERCACRPVAGAGSCRVGECAPAPRPE
jgi:hypothetical protein